MTTPEDLIENLDKTHLFAEAPYISYSSPYYKPYHFKLVNKYRTTLKKYIEPYVDKWDEQKSYPESVRETLYKQGIYAIGYPIEYGGQSFENNELDAFAAIIVGYEWAKMACGGLFSSLNVMGIGLPPLIKSGSEYLKNKYIKPVLTGKKSICLCVSEPNVGSDVRNINTIAIRDTKNPDIFIINGEKFWITNGCKANYYTVVCKTPNETVNSKQSLGLNMTIFLIDGDDIRSDINKGQIITQRMKTQGWWASNTGHIIFKNCHVSSKNIIGKINLGWMAVMKNFNNERFSMAISSNGYSIVCLNEAIKYAKQRKTFGKKLIKHQIIRHKLINMLIKIQSTHYLIERCAYLINNIQGNGKIFMNNKKMNKKDRKYLSSMCAMAKVQATQTMEYCAREASQIFGGRSYLRGGRGKKIERIYREVRVMAIGGGSEEILIDLIARQAKL